MSQWVRRQPTDSPTCRLAPERGINVPIAVPMAFYSFGGWKASLFGDTHVHGPEGVSFYTQAKVATARWPRAVLRDEAQLHFPTAE
jgi:malonate-semialdehyde dehydrogenase (acetylating)/methylmalonate-semialdehyde dehydrogenase